MKIVFTQGKKKIEIPLSGVSEVKLYGVPTAYSADGFFASVWMRGELEPVPACAVAESILLAHVELSRSDGGLQLLEHVCREGVSYAQN